MKLQVGASQLPSYRRAIVSLCLCGHQIRLLLGYLFYHVEVHEWALDLVTCIADWRAQVRTDTEDMVEN